MNRQHNFFIQNLFTCKAMISQKVKSQALTPIFVLSNTKIIRQILSAQLSEETHQQEERYLKEVIRLLKW